MSAGPETFQSVNGRLVAQRIGEGHQFPMDQITVSGRAAKARRADLLLPTGVGQWIGGDPAQDQSFRHLELRKTSVGMVEPASDHGLVLNDTAKRKTHSFYR